MELSKIETLIHVVRGQRVMFDRDLASLYGVETKVLNRAVLRHKTRFPADFMFQLSRDEWEHLKCQFGTSSWGGDRRALPHVFTEQGVAMLSGVLNSPRAVAVNVEIMRAFVRLRRVLAANRDLAERLEKAEEKLAAHEDVLGEHAEALRSVFEDIRSILGPPDGPRGRIGF